MVEVFLWRILALVGLERTMMSDGVLIGLLGVGIDFVGEELGS